MLSRSSASTLCQNNLLLEMPKSSRGKLTANVKCLSLKLTVEASCNATHSVQKCALVLDAGVPCICEHGMHIHVHVCTLRVNFLSY